jgi:hypothetical protein
MRMDTRVGKCSKLMSIDEIPTLDELLVKERGKVMSAESYEPGRPTRTESSETCTRQQKGEATALQHMLQVHKRRKFRNQASGQKAQRQERQPKMRSSETQVRKECEDTRCSTRYKCTSTENFYGVYQSRKLSARIGQSESSET